MIPLFHHFTCQSLINSVKCDTLKFGITLIIGGQSKGVHSHIYVGRWRSVKISSLHKKQSTTNSLGATDFITAE